MINDFYAIKPSVLKSVMSQVDKFKSLDQSPDTMPIDANSRLYRVQDGVAIIEVSGVITRYDNFFTAIFGGTSIQRLNQALEAAVSDSQISGIILDINSPGGELAGTPEFAEAVNSAREEKPVVSYVSRLGASAAYWIASASDAIVLHETAEVGSIGVVATVFANEDGEYDFVSSVSPHKRPDPETDEGRATIQEEVDTLGRIFVDKVAFYRSVSPNVVLSDYGQGKTLIGESALAAGMVEKVGRFRDALEMIGGMNMDSNQNQELAALKAQVESMVDPSAISVEWLQASAPDVAKSLLEAGAKSERERVSGIMGVQVGEIPADTAHEARQNAITEGITDGEFAKAVLTLNTEHRQQQVESRVADAEKIPEASGEVEDKEAEDAKIDSVIEAAAQKVRR